MSKKDNHIKLENHPKLSKNIFDVPEGYFSDLSSRLMEAAEIEDSTLYQSQKLKKQPFEVPHNYFDELTENILEKTIHQETKVIPMYQQTWFKWTEAAAVLVLAISFYFLSPIRANISDASLSQISDDTIIEYLNTEENNHEELYSNVEYFDVILDDMIADELDVFADLLSTNTELDYHFEYFDY